MPAKLLIPQEILHSVETCPHFQAHHVSTSDSKKNKRVKGSLQHHIAQVRFKP